jgi:hypothetical protein
MERFNAPSSLYNGTHNQRGGYPKKPAKSSPKKVKTDDSQGITKFRKANRLLTLEINKLKKELEREKVKNDRLTEELSRYKI